MCIWGVRVWVYTCACVYVLCVCEREKERGAPSILPDIEGEGGPNEHDFGLPQTTPFLDAPHDPT